MVNFESVESSIIKALEDSKAINESSMKSVKEISTRCNRTPMLIQNVIDGMIKGDLIKSGKKNAHVYYYLQNKK